MIKQVFCSAILAASLSVAAQIKVGQTAAFTGGPSGSVKEMTIGARLIFEDVNRSGGVHGQRIELVSVDDAFDVKKAVANAEALIVREKVIALFLNRGTPHTEAMVPLLARHRVPLVAPSTGAMSLHEPAIPYIFNVRSTYQVEAEQAVLQFDAMGIGHQIGVVYVGDSFGEDALKGALRGFERIKKKPLFAVPYDRKTENMDEVLRYATTKVPGADVYPALLMVGSNSAISAGIRKIRAAGSRAYIGTLSSNASGGFIKALGEHAEFVMVSQAFPRETAIDIPMVLQATELLKRAKGDDNMRLRAKLTREMLDGLSVTPAMLEGVAGAKLLVEALKKSGPPFTSARLVAALESGTRFSIGWTNKEISYSPIDHSGIRFSETSIITRNHKFQR